MRAVKDAPKMTLPPSFHISVTTVSPGYSEPANRTLISLKAPYFSYTALPAKPKKHKPCRMGCLKPPTLSRTSAESASKMQCRTWRILDQCAEDCNHQRDCSRRSDQKMALVYNFAPVDGRLPLIRLRFGNVIWCSRGRLVDCCSRPSVYRHVS